MSNTEFGWAIEELARYEAQANDIVIQGYTGTRGGAPSEIHLAFNSDVLINEIEHIAERIGEGCRGMGIESVEVSRDPNAPLTLAIKGNAATPDGLVKEIANLAIAHYENGNEKLKVSRR